MKLGRELSLVLWVRRFSPKNYSFFQILSSVFKLVMSKTLLPYVQTMHALSNMILILLCSTEMQSVTPNSSLSAVSSLKNDFFFPKAKHKINETCLVDYCKDWKLLVWQSWPTHTLVWNYSKHRLKSDLEYFLKLRITNKQMCQKLMGFFKSSFVYKHVLFKSWFSTCGNEYVCAFCGSHPRLRREPLCWLMLS